MTYTTDQLLALALAVSFAAGLNVYAVVATLGLLAQLDVVELPASIAVVSNWWVIGISGALFTIEFFADKVPLFDLVWNSLQFFVRVPVGTLLAFSATNGLPLSLQLTATVGGAVLAASAASAKLAARSAATTSPEPFSNVALSLVEDVVAIGLTWFATSYPWLAASIALTLFVVVVLVLRWIVRTVADAVRRRSSVPR